MWNRGRQELRLGSRSPARRTRKGVISYKLCDLGQVGLPLLASDVFDAEENNTCPIRLLWVPNEMTDVDVLCRAWRSELLLWCSIQGDRELWFRPVITRPHICESPLPLLPYSMKYQCGPLSWNILSRLVPNRRFHNDLYHSSSPERERLRMHALLRGSSSHYAHHWERSSEQGRHDPYPGEFQPSRRKSQW